MALIGRTDLLAGKCANGGKRILGGDDEVTRSGIIILLLCALGGAPSLSIAQADTVPTLQRSLAGSGSRKWVFRRIVKSMGTDPGCVSGEFWSFTTDGVLTISTCIDRRWVEKTYRYTLRQEGPIDIAVSVAGKEAPFPGERRIRITEAGRKLIIRAMSPTKDVAQEDLVFSRSGS